MAKCYVKAFFDWIEQTEALEDDERGRLFVAILEYARSGIATDLAGRESILFPVFKAQVDRDLENSTAYAENGKKGGKTKNSSRTEPKQTKPNQSEPKRPNKEKEEDKKIFQQFHRHCDMEWQKNPDAFAEGETCHAAYPESWVGR